MFFHVLARIIDWHHASERLGDCAKATGRAFARFHDKEMLDAAFHVFGRYARSRGLPRGMCVDKAGIYRSETADGEPTLTQFGRAMKDLGVERILANSPQAQRSRIRRLPRDGRVKRMHGTLQDRLVKDLRLRGVKDMAVAYALLEKSFRGQGFGGYPAEALTTER